MSLTLSVSSENNKNNYFISRVKCKRQQPCIWSVLCLFNSHPPVWEAPAPRGSALPIRLLL